LKRKLKNLSIFISFPFNIFPLKKVLRKKQRHGKTEKSLFLRLLVEFLRSSAKGQKMPELFNSYFFFRAQRIPIEDCTLHCRPFSESICKKNSRFLGFDR
jgi:hypothetical protein